MQRSRNDAWSVNPFGYRHRGRLRRLRNSSPRTTRRQQPMNRRAVRLAAARRNCIIDAGAAPRITFTASASAVQSPPADCTVGIGMNASLSPHSSTSLTAEAR